MAPFHETANQGARFSALPGAVFTTVAQETVSPVLSQRPHAAAGLCFHSVHIISPSFARCRPTWRLLAWCKRASPILNAIKHALDLSGHSRSRGLQVLPIANALISAASHIGGKRRPDQDRGDPPVVLAVRFQSSEDSYTPLDYKWGTSPVLPVDAPTSSVIRSCDAPLRPPQFIDR